MDANTYLIEPHRLPERRLWYGFTAAAFAWILEGAIGVIVSAQFCPADAPGWGILGQNSVRLALGVVTIILLIVAISGAVVSFRNWQTLSGGSEFAHSEGRTREAFMSIGGIVVSSVFILGILWSGIPLIMLEQCLRAR